MIRPKLSLWHAFLLDLKKVYSFLIFYLGTFLSRKILLLVSLIDGTKNINIRNFGENEQIEYQLTSVKCT